MMIPISAIELGPDVEESVLAVIRSGMIAQGPVVKQFEDRFAALIGVDHVVAVNSGTTALIAALRVSGVGPGDEVITSAFTFAATLNAILNAGATARFADISLSDFNVDPDSISALIGPRSAVLLPVHLYGQPADMPTISVLAAERGLTIVEDAAQAHLARIGERAAGSWGIGCFSLYATKNLTTGEGGLISTNDGAFADRLRVLRNQGMRARYEYEVAGCNYRLTDLQAAMGLPQLDRYEGTVRIRRANARSLTELLADVPWLRLPAELPGRRHVWHQYTVLVEDDAPLDRHELVDHLARSGVGSGIYYPRLVHDYVCYRDDSRVIQDATPNAVEAARRCLSLPVHPGVRPADLDRIAEALHSAGTARR
jgi:perosamine synthetase